MGADLNVGQTAVVHILAVMGAAADGALDGSVRCAVAAVIGTSGMVPPVNKKSGINA